LLFISPPQQIAATLLEGRMTAQRIAGLVLVVVGIVALVWGGVFWTNRDTVIDAGPIEVTTEERQGVSLPPVVGAIALVGGIVLLVIPARKSR
jgi:drug/metabolite transporter (DMT)-like permease